MTCLWPERDTAHARNLLKQAVYVVRAELGADAIDASLDRIRLNPARLGVDVVDFESALARGDRSTAVRLYRGPFLDGFFLSDAPEFDEWAERQRGRLSGAYATALESLAEAAMAEHDLSGAVETWRALAAHDPYDSRIARRLVSALEAVGNPAGALQAATVHARLLQAELGVEPPSELAAAVERLRADPSARRPPTVTPPPTADRPESGGTPGPGMDGGAAAIGPPAGVGAAAGALAESAPRQTGFLAGVARHRRIATVAVAAVVVAAALLGLPHMRSRTRSSAAPPVPFASVAVLPLVSRSSDPADAAFADGMTREIINVLSERDGLRVSASTSVFRLRNLRLDVRAVADSLRVAHVLEGDVEMSGSRLRMRLRLIDAQDGLTRWSGTYDRDLKDVFAVQDEIASVVAGELGLALASGARQPRRREPTLNVAAYELYLRGSDPALTRSDSGARQRLAYFRQAVALDSTYAQAYAGLASTYIRLSMNDQADFSAHQLQSLAEASATRAVALDDSLAVAHEMLGIVRMRARAYAAAEKELRRAIDLDPGDVAVHQSLAGFYLVTGRAAEGLVEAERALELDSLSATAVAEHARALLFNGRCDEALTQLERLAAVRPPLLRVSATAAQCYAARGEWADAIAVLEPPRKRDATSLALSGYMLGRAGRRDEAMEVLDTLIDRWQRRHQGADRVAMVYAGLGDRDAAFSWLDRGFDDGSLVLNPWFGEIMEPIFAELRRDPRFQRVRRRLELPSTSTQR
jgi:adenylate cyclase